MYQSFVPRNTHHCMGLPYLYLARPCLFGNKRKRIICDLCCQSELSEIIMFFLWPYWIHLDYFRTLITTRTLQVIWWHGLQSNTHTHVHIRRSILVSWDKCKMNVIRFCDRRLSINVISASNYPRATPVCKVSVLRNSYGWRKNVFRTFSWYSFYSVYDYLIGVMNYNFVSSSSI